MSKLIAWGLVFFAGYSAWTYVPVYMNRSTVEHVLETAVAGLSHHSSEDQIRSRVIRAASRGAELELSEEMISVATERRTGEFWIAVDVVYPTTVAYLGSERIIDNAVHIEAIVPVDEAAESRRLANQRRNEEANRRMAAASERYYDKVRDELERCRRQTGGECTFEQMPGGSGTLDDPQFIRMY